MRVSARQVKFNLLKRGVRVEEALSLESFIVARVGKLLAQGARALEPETSVVCRLFQIPELMRSVVVSKDKPELVPVGGCEYNPALRLHDVLENVHVDLPRDVLVEHRVGAAFAGQETLNHILRHAGRLFDQIAVSLVVGRLVLGLPVLRLAS